MESAEDRYFVIREADGTWSLCDRRIDETQRDQRIVIGLEKDPAAELVERLNGLHIGRKK